MRVLVIGASGQVGAELRRQLRARGDEVVGTHQSVAIDDTIALDVGDHAATRACIEATAPDAVYFTAAYTHVDGCEEHPARAFAVNRDGPGAAAAAAARRHAAFVFYSTEYVFDGTSGPYAEDDTVRPLSVYGQSKLDGERAVLDAHADALVIRTTVVYGIDRQAKNFVYQMLRRAHAGERIHVPSDQRSSPTYVEDLSAASIALVEKRQHGVIHVAGPEVLDRYAFAMEVCKAFAIDAGIVDPVATRALNQKAARPLGAGLRVDRAVALGITTRGPAAGLAAMRAALSAERC